MGNTHSHRVGRANNRASHNYESMYDYSTEMGRKKEERAPRTATIAEKKEEEEVLFCSSLLESEKRGRKYSTKLWGALQESTYI